MINFVFFQSGCEIFVNEAKIQLVPADPFKECTITMIRFVFLRSIIITMMINRSLVKQSNRF